MEWRSELTLEAPAAEKSAVGSCLRGEWCGGGDSAGAGCSLHDRLGHSEAVVDLGAVDIEAFDLYEQELRQRVQEVLLRRGDFPPRIGRVIASDLF